jgi:hypothetical protein
MFHDRGTLGNDESLLRGLEFGLKLFLSLKLNKYIVEVRSKS